MHPLFRVVFLSTSIVSSSAYHINPITDIGQKRCRKHGKSFHRGVFSWSVSALEHEASDGNKDGDEVMMPTPYPLDSVDALDALVRRDEITKLSKSKSNLQGTLQVLWHAGCYVLAARLYPYSPLISTVAMSFVGSFFFHGFHETVHRTAFKSKLLNDIVAHMFGFLCGRPAIHYRYYHWQHHRYTGNPKLDSELQAGSFLDLPVDTILGYFWYLSGIPFWIDAASTLWRHSTRGKCPELYLKEKPVTQQRQVIREARVYLGLYLIIGALSFLPRYGFIREFIMTYWIIPAVVGQPFLRFYLLAEHRGRIESPLIYENTRTIKGTNRLYRKLAWNMPYHTEHHAWPSVPFWKLPEAHQLLVDSSESSTPTNRVYEVFGKGEMVSSPNDKHYLHQGYLAFNFRFIKNLWTKNDR